MNKEKISKLLPGIIVVILLIVGLGGIAILSQQKKSDPLSEYQRTPVNIIDVAKSIGLNESQFISDITSEELKKKVDEDKATGDEMMGDRRSTPSFFVNDVFFPQKASQTQAEFINSLKVEIDKLITEKPEDKPKVIEFFDFNCGFCASINPLVDQFILEYGDKIVFEKKNYPFLSKSSRIYAIGYEAAKKQDKGEEFAREIFNKLTKK